MQSSHLKQTTLWPIPPSCDFSFVTLHHQSFNTYFCEVLPRYHFTKYSLFS